MVPAGAVPCWGGLLLGWSPAGVVPWGVPCWGDPLLGWSLRGGPLGRSLGVVPAGAVLCLGGPLLGWSPAGAVPWGVPYWGGPLLGWSFRGGPSGKSTELRRSKGVHKNREKPKAILGQAKGASLRTPGKAQGAPGSELGLSFHKPGNNSELSSVL